MHNVQSRICKYTGYKTRRQTNTHRTHMRIQKQQVHTYTQGKYTHKTHTITQTSPLTKGGAHISSLTKTPIMTSPPGQLIS